jgi:hypothetical protein
MIQRRSSAIREKAIALHESADTPETGRSETQYGYEIQEYRRKFYDWHN